MKERTIQHFRRVAFIILFTISNFLTINLFIQFTENVFFKVIWGSLAFALEIIKAYLFLETKKKFKDTYTHKNPKKLGQAMNYMGAVMMFTIYFGLASVSAVASMGFTLTTIQEQSFTASVQNATVDSVQFQVEQKLKDIDDINRQIESALTRQEGKGADWQSLSERGNEELSGLREEKDILTKEIEALYERQAEAKEESYTIDSMDVFTLMGSKVDLSGADTMLYIMMVLIILLEVCLAMTAGEIKGDNTDMVERTRTNNLLRYIDSLLAIKGVRLKSDKRISSDTGIPLVECQRYREILQNIKHNGVPLITTVRGGSRANFSQREMHMIVVNRMKKQREANR